VTEDDVTATEERIAAEMEAAVQAARAADYPDPVVDAATEFRA
jgi:hypothetical protein